MRGSRVPESEGETVFEGAYDASVTAEQSIEQGEFQDALAALTQETSGPAADPARLLMRFNVEVRLQRFGEASTTMQRLLAAAPQLSGPMSEFGASAQAEAQATARLRDPELAGRRKAVGLPSPYALALTKACVHHAQGDTAGAAAAIQEAKAATPPIGGTLVRASGHSQRFTAITDTDALTGATVPLYRGGELFDLAFGDLRSLVFAPPKTSFDVMWAPVEVSTVDGQRFHARMPTLYAGSGVATDPHLRSGRETAWDHRCGYAVASGQRDWSLTVDGGGQSLVGVQGVVRVDFENAPRSMAPGAGHLAQGASGHPGAWGPQGATGPGAWGPPGGPGAWGQAGPSPLAAGVRSLAGITVIALGARAALPAISWLTGMAGVSLLNGAAYDLLKNVIGLAAIVLYFVWFSRLYGWVRQARGGTEFSTGWAIGAWFIPFVNFVVPYRALDDAAKRTVGAPVPLVGAWWAAYMVSILLQVFFRLALGGVDVGVPLGLYELLSWLSLISQIVAYGAWAKLVRDLSARVS